ncbi:MAG: GGDEF domain-containing protein [Planctomycetes bacterium]|nr:GGDEF domain-containing protein [Planctomycetota bacterium]
MSRFTDAALLLQKLSELSSSLSVECGDSLDLFDHPLEILEDVMGFDLSVLYRVSNTIGDYLILEVVKVIDRQGKRPELAEGKRLRLNLREAEGVFINEISAFNKKGLSALNVPGSGCDLVGYIHIAEVSGGAYLLGGDLLASEAKVQSFEISVCEIMCNFFSTLLLRLHYQHLATFDSLTGLYNSRKIRGELDTALKRIRRGDHRPLSIVMVDIDHFKRLNDEHSHLQGDRVLEEVGKLFSGQIRSDLDLVGRYGGEEFLILLENTGFEDAKTTMERMRAAIEEHPFTQVGEDGQAVEGKTLRVTMSFGISSLQEGMEAPLSECFLAHADGMLYQSKKTGRNKVSAGLFSVDS